MNGFIPSKVDLLRIKNIHVGKLLLIGDGMSGKTQIIITLGKLITKYLYQIYLIDSEPIDRQKVANLQLELSLIETQKQLGFEDTNTDDVIINEDFRKWAKQHRFIVHYGKKNWFLDEINLDVETVGLEDFRFVFPYLYNGETYRISLVGSDIGGQNIFDHLRAIMGKLADPNDNLLIIFDLSRVLSCKNSLEQLKKVLLQFGSVKKIPTMFYIGNKIDLVEYIRRPEWSEQVLNFVLEELSRSINQGYSYTSIPSLLYKNENDRIIKYFITNNKISFPDLEAIIYNAIKKTDPHTQKTVMTEVNAKSLGREIAAQAVYNQYTRKVQSEIGFEKFSPDHEEYKEAMKELLKRKKKFLREEFSELLFQRRPLALQYAQGMEVYAKNGEKEDKSSERIRKKWSKFSLDLEFITKSELYSCISEATNFKELLTDMENVFYTNGIVGTGIQEMINFIIEKDIDRTFKGKKIKRERTKRIVGRL